MSDVRYLFVNHPEMWAAYRGPTGLIRGLKVREQFCVSTVFIRRKKDGEHGMRIVALLVSLAFSAGIAFSAQASQLTTAARRKPERRMSSMN